MALERTVTAELITHIDTQWIPNSLRVSGDSQHAAYITDADAGFAVVRNGVRKNKVFDGIGDLTFSRNGERFAYRAQVGDRQCVVVDGQELGSFDGTGQGSLCFSPDGQHVAYAVQTENRWSVIVDGQEEGDHDGLAGLIFSPDSQRVAYRVQREGQEHAVVDGKVGPAYGAVRDLLFSPDGQRVAYRAKWGDRWCAVIDHTAGATFDAIEDESICFNPSSQQLTYVARRGIQSFVVVDGAESTPYAGVEPPLTHSSDGQRLAFVASKARFARMPFLGSYRFLVVDGRAGDKASGIKDITFSPDGRRLAFAERQGTTWSIVVDAQRMDTQAADTGYESLGDLTFGPDSRRLAYGAKSGVRYVVVVDDSEGTAYDGVVLGAAGGRIRFLAPNTLRYLALKGDDLYAVEENIQDVERTQVQGGA